jgi:hypothetical protein
MYFILNNTAISHPRVFVLLTSDDAPCGRPAASSPGMWLQGTDALIDDLRQGSDASVDRQPQKQLEELELAQELTVTSRLGGNGKHNLT